MNSDSRDNDARARVALGLDESDRRTRAMEHLIIQREFAEQASGAVHVFHPAHGVAIGSVWAQVEYPTLIANPQVTAIIYHIV